jgi:hypothetical protein
LAQLNGAEPRCEQEGVHNWNAFGKREAHTISF